MATWRTIAATETDPEAPITSALMKALADNPRAIAEGASGADKILDAALGSTVTTAGQNWVAARLSTATVNGFTAGSSVGGIGTYGFFRTGSARVPGDTIGGSALRYTDANSNLFADTPSGTWRCMGRANADIGTVWLRIS